MDNPTRFEVTRERRVTLNETDPNLHRGLPTAAVIAAVESIRRDSPLEGTYYVQKTGDNPACFKLGAKELVFGDLSPTLSFEPSRGWPQLMRPAPACFLVTFNFKINIFEENRLVQDYQLAFRAAKRAHEVLREEESIYSFEFVVEPVGTQVLERWRVFVADGVVGHQVWDSHHQEWRMP
jgi:hypothetical protein